MVVYLLPRKMLLGLRKITKPYRNPRTYSLVTRLDFQATFTLICNKSKLGTTMYENRVSQQVNTSRVN